MGYRFVIREVEYPEVIKAGETAQIRLKIENKGVAPIYNKLPLKLRFKGEKVQEYVTGVDITKWLPGEHTEKIEIVLPKDIPAGKYELSFLIGGGKESVVKFATETETDGKFYSLAEIEIKE